MTQEQSHETTIAPVDLNKVETNETMSDIQEKIDHALEEARTACNSNPESTECAVAWDEVEELQAEASHQRQVKPKTSFEKYCDDNPDAVECRLYDE